VKSLLVLLLFFLVFSGCSSLTSGLLKDPDVKVVDFKVTNVTLDDVAISVQMNIKNPNPIPLKLDSVSYALKFSGEQVTNGVFDQGINIPASGENNVSIPFTFKYSSVGNLISSLLKHTFTKDYELTGSAKLGLFSIPFAKKGEVKFNN
jgi:LEA14-like dessication related protein